MSVHNLPFNVIYEDQDLLVLDKPAGWVVNAADSTRAPVVQTEMAEYLTSSISDKQTDWQDLVPADFDPQWGSPAQIFADRQGMVHRLDKDTSGCLLWAKNPGALVNLLAQFKNRQVQKTYTVLVHGQVDPSQGTIDLPLSRNPQNRQRIAVHPDGRHAVTDYQTQQVWHDDRGQDYSLITCQPHTGRMHQIRAHFDHINHPLVSDFLYLGKKRIKSDKTWCPRQFLHASQITFIHPRSQKSMTMTADLPQDLSTALSHLAK